LDLADVLWAAGIGAVDGVLMVDEAAHPDAAALPAELATVGVGHCVFVSWDVTDIELAASSSATGYVMVQSRPGPTGTKHLPVVPDRQVKLVRGSAPGVPVVAGFGIKDAATLRLVATAGVDGFVTGSAAVKALCDGGPDALDALLRELTTEAASIVRSTPRRAADCIGST
ncbi:MAG: hypothetical protein C4344_01795, partial [Acidimicrobiia bacterium]